MSNLTAINFVEEFCQVLDEGGDTFFSTDGGNRDMQIIKSTIEGQGYWAGNSFRYFFDLDKLEIGVVKLLRTEERILA